MYKTLLDTKVIFLTYCIERAEIEYCVKIGKINTSGFIQSKLLAKVFDWKYSIKKAMIIDTDGERHIIHLSRENCTAWGIERGAVANDDVDEYWQADFDADWLWRNDSVGCGVMFEI